MGGLEVYHLAELERITPTGVSINEDLSALSRWKIGGNADLVLRPKSSFEVASLCSYFKERDIIPVVIGSTSNLLFADDGLRVPCIIIGDRMAHLEIEDLDIFVGAGYWVPFLARKAMQAGLTGLEHISGIPGTLGGLICMNGGSQRKGISSHIISVESVTTGGSIITRTMEEIEFSYRYSSFHDNSEIITAAHLKLDLGKKSRIRREMLDILTERSRKFPRKQPNCGSTFVSDPALYSTYGPPGAIIERLGLKGYCIGGAEVSHDHANFVVNTGRATANDILTVIRDINKRVVRKTGRALLAEVRYIHPNGMSEPASSAASRLKEL